MSNPTITVVGFVYNDEDEGDYEYSSGRCGCPCGSCHKCDPEMSGPQGFWDTPANAPSVEIDHVAGVVENLRTDRDWFEWDSSAPADDFD